MTQPRATQAQADALRQAFKMMEAIRSAIVSAGPQGLPSGPLYAVLMAKGLSYDHYAAMISAMVGAGKITQTGDILRGVKA